MSYLRYHLSSSLPSLMYRCLPKKNCCHCLRRRNFISLQRDAACHCRYTTPAATIPTTPPLPPSLTPSPFHAALSSHFAVTIAMYLRGIWGIYLRVPIEHKATATTTFTTHTHEYSEWIHNDCLFSLSSRGLGRNTPHKTRVKQPKQFIACKAHCKKSIRFFSIIKFMK